MASFRTLPAFDFSNLDLSKLDLSKLDLSSLPGVDVDRLRDALRDAAYITIGFGVLGVQQAQVRRRELVSFLSDRLGTSREQVEQFLASIPTPELPDLGYLLGQAQSTVETLRKQLVGLVRQAA